MYATFLRPLKESIQRGNPKVSSVIGRCWLWELCCWRVSFLVVRTFLMWELRIVPAKQWFSWKQAQWDHPKGRWQSHKFECTVRDSLRLDILILLCLEIPFFFEVFFYNYNYNYRNLNYYGENWLQIILTADLHPWLGDSDLSENELQGPIPPELGQLLELNYLWASSYFLENSHFQIVDGFYFNPPCLFTGNMQFAIPGIWATTISQVPYQCN